MKRILFGFVLSLVALGAGSINVRATILTWNGSTSTLWNNATNWLPQQVPTASDTVVFNSGNLTATTNTPFATMYWNGGNLLGALTVSNGTTLYLGGSSTLFLYGALTNAGTVVVTNTSFLRLYYSPATYYGAIYNLAGGLFDIQNDLFYIHYNYGGEFFVNAGTLRKSAGAGSTAIFPQLINTGLVDAQSGTISFRRGGTLGGQFNAAAGATVAFDTGSYTIGTLPTVTGAGAVKFNGDTLTLFNDVVPNLQLLGGTLYLGPSFQGGSITNLTLTGMTLATTNTVRGTMVWTAGSILGALTVSNGATLYLGGSSTLFLYGALTNAGTVVVSNTSFLRLYYSPPTYFGAIYNLAGGLFDFKNDQFYIHYNYGGEFFVNAGTLRKSAGVGTTAIFPQLINTGLVDAQTGTISFRRGGTLGGQFNAAAGATVAFDTGSYTVGVVPTLTGAGAVKFNGDTLTLLNDVVPNLQLLGGTLYLGPSFQGGSITNLTLAGISLVTTNTVRGTMVWTAGSILGALTVSNGATLYLGGSSALFLYGALTNAGTVVVSNTSFLRLYYSPPNNLGAIYNLAGGLFDFKNDLFYIHYNYGGEFFVNAGTLRKSAGAGTTAIFPQLINTGLVDAQSGTISFRRGGTLGGQFNAAAGATVAFDNGSYTVGVVPTLTGAGAVKFNGDTLTLFNDVVPNLQLLGGTLYLGPSFQGGSITNLTLTGMTLATTNTVRGTMNWTAGSILGALTVSNGATLYLGGSSALFLYGALTNAGTVVVSNTSFLRLYYSPPNSVGAIYNLAGGLFDIKNDQFYIHYNYGGEFFINAGTLRKSAGVGATAIFPQLINTGLVDAQTGMISFRRGGTLGGQFNAAAGGTVAFDAGSYTIGVPPTVTGAGAVKFNGDTLTLLSNTVPNLQMLAGTLLLGPGFQGGSITNLTLTGMSLVTTNTVRGTMAWTAGSILGALTVSNGATLYLGGSSSLFLYGALTNAGTVVVSNTSFLRLYYSPPNSVGAIYNLAGGLFDIKNDQFYMHLNYGGEFFVNAGTLRKSAGSGTTTIYPQLTNSGLVDVQTGTLALQKVPNLASGELRFGLTGLNNYGKMSISGNASLAGTVGVVWLGGYVPATNNSFTVLTYSSRTGIFNSLDLPSPASWATNYTATTFTLTVAIINKLVFSVEPVGGKLTNSILAPVVVQVTYPTNTPVATNGVPVTLSLVGGGLINGTLTQNTDAAGKATFNDLSFSDPGFKTFRAASSSQTPATSLTFRIFASQEVQWTTNGFLLSLYGSNNLGTTIIYTTTNLALPWIPIYTNAPTNGAIQFTDRTSTNSKVKFYHAIEQ